MRMRTIPPGQLCSQHLLGEHLEMHMFAGTIAKGISIQGYTNRGLVNPNQIKSRHDSLAKEMVRRGYNHLSPLDLDYSSLPVIPIPVRRNKLDLSKRCKYCNILIQSQYLLPSTMKRLPDARNSSPVSDFTQVPNEVLTNPLMTSKAKIILCLLLSKPFGWVSYQKELQKHLKEGINSIQSGIQELEQFGYLKIIKYRSIKTKKFAGSFWAYTSTRNQFDFQPHLEQLTSEGFEITKNQAHENHGHGNHDMETMSWKSESNNIIRNNTNKKKINKKSEWIQLFEDFWLAYPRKIGKDFALKCWIQLFEKTYPNEPSLEVLLKAIHEQAKKWDNPKYIPHPSTWLNHRRYLDEVPSEVKDDAKISISTTVSSDVLHFLKKDVYRDALQRAAFTSKENKQKLLQRIIQLYQDIDNNQDPTVLKSGAIPNAHLIVVEYWEWLSSQDWVDEIKVSFFDWQGKMFQLFYKHICKEHNMDILTGGFYGG